MSRQYSRDFNYKNTQNKSLKASQTSKNASKNLSNYFNLMKQKKLLEQSENPQNDQKSDFLTKKMQKSRTPFAKISSSKDSKSSRNKSSKKKKRYGASKSSRLKSRIGTARIELNKENSQKIANSARLEVNNFDSRAKNIQKLGNLLPQDEYNYDLKM